MPRRGEFKKREILPDPKHKDVLVAKFINYIMQDGEKSTAERIVYNAFNIISKREKEEPLAVFKKAFENVKPVVEVKSRRVGGATYQVPVEVKTRRKTSLALRWLVTGAQGRGEKTMEERVAMELLDAYAKKGVTIKKRDDVHRMAEANKAFAHYRW